MLDISLEEACDWISNTGATRVAIQLPEGLKARAREIIEELEHRTDRDFFVMADRCFGACDIPSDFRTYADLLLHFGHSEIPAIDYGEDVFFVEVCSPSDPLPLLPEAVKRLTHEIGLVTTAQHVDKLPEVREWLATSGYEVQIGEGDSRIKHRGQVLGCNVTAASSVQGEVTSFLYVGTGDFHPLAVALETGKPVVVLDPVMNEVREMAGRRERLLRQRHAAIERASLARSIAVLITTKQGQSRMDVALEIGRMLDDKGKSVIYLVMDEITPDLLMPYDVDAYVSTACPRLALDDFSRYDKPILTPQELKIALGDEDWADYRMDRIMGE